MSTYWKHRAKLALEAAGMHQQSTALAVTALAKSMHAAHEECSDPKPARKWIGFAATSVKGFPDVLYRIDSEGNVERWIDMEEYADEWSKLNIADPSE